MDRSSSNMNFPLFPNRDLTNNNIDSTVFSELQYNNSSSTKKNSTKEQSNMKSNKKKSTKKKPTKKKSTSSSSKTNHLPPTNSGASKQPTQDRPAHTPDEPDLTEYTTLDSDKSFTELMSDAPDFMKEYTDRVFDEFMDDAPTFFETADAMAREVEENPHLFGRDDPGLAEEAGIEAFINSVEQIAETVENQPSIQEQQPPRPQTSNHQQTPQSKAFNHPSGSSSRSTQHSN